MKKVVVQGMGYVGFVNAIACAIAKDNNKYLYNVVTLERNNSIGINKLKKFNNKIAPIKTLDKKIDKIFVSQMDIGNLTCTVNDDCIKNADIVLSCIDLDDQNFSKNLKMYIKSIENIFKKIKKKKCDIIIQSTLPPGVIEKKIYPSMIKILSGRKISFNKISLSYSYERVTPGSNYLKSILQQDRVYSGINSYSKNRCKIFFKSILSKNSKLHQVKSITDCEFSKIVENSYRAMNIAITDEWVKYAKYLGVDLYRIVKLISLRPTHSNIMSPGIGVGGYCLPKDPNFMRLSNKYLFNKMLFKFPMTKMTLRINDEMYLNSLKIILDNLKKNKKILFAGVAYKENVDDLRNSPSIKLIKKLIKYYNVEVFDPLVEKLNISSSKIKKVDRLEKKYDAVVIGVMHNIFKKKYFLDNLIKYNKKIIVFDANNFLKKNMFNKNLNIINLTT